MYIAGSYQSSVLCISCACYMYFVRCVSSLVVESSNRLLFRVMEWLSIKTISILTNYGCHLSNQSLCWFHIQTVNVYKLILEVISISPCFNASRRVVIYFSLLSSRLFIVLLPYWNWQVTYYIYTFICTWIPSVEQFLGSWYFQQTVSCSQYGTLLYGMYVI